MRIALFLPLAACASLGPLPYQGRTAAAVFPPTPEACVQGYWKPFYEEDYAGSYVYLAEPYRTASKRDRDAYLGRGRATLHLAHAIETRFHVTFDWESTSFWKSERRPAPKLVIQSVKIDGDRAWVEAVHATPAIVSGLESFHLVRKDGAWYIDDQGMGTYVSASPTEYLEDQATVYETASRGLEALARDIESGALTFEGAKLRYKPIVQAEVDQDAVAGRIVDEIESASLAGAWSSIPLASPFDDASEHIQDGCRDRKGAIEALLGKLEDAHADKAAATVHKWFDGAFPALPHARGHLDDVSGSGGRITITWSDPSLEGGIRSTYTVQKTSDGWRFVPGDSDLVFGFLTTRQKEQIVIQSCKDTAADVRRAAGELADPEHRVADLVEADRKRLLATFDALEHPPADVASPPEAPKIPAAANLGESVMTTLADLRDRDRKTGTYRFSARMRGRMFHSGAAEWPAPGRWTEDWNGTVIVMPVPEGSKSGLIVLCGRSKPPATLPAVWECPPHSLPDEKRP